ncbi:hypothetical protein [Leptospira alexanderi]|nr:hypothetical protein [Leptospira alexanderi]
MAVLLYVEISIEIHYLYAYRGVLCINPPIWEFEAMRTKTTAI